MVMRLPINDLENPEDSTNTYLDISITGEDANETEVKDSFYRNQTLLHQNIVVFSLTSSQLVILLTNVYYRP